MCMFLRTTLRLLLATLFVFLCVRPIERACADEPNANAVSLATSANPMTLVLDAHDATRGIMIAHLTLPVKPGPFTFVYPKWIPGEHGPTGPLNDLADIHVSANGVTLAWSRDLVDFYAFHVDVPPNVGALDIDFNVLLNAPGDHMASTNTAVVNWNRDLVYQNDTNSQDVFVKASIILPAGWDFGTALPVAHRDGDRIEFAQVDLTTLVDSPLDCGLYAKHVGLWANGAAVAELDMFADRPSDLDLSQDTITTYKRMITETLAMYGSRHWNVYHSLLALSDTIDGQGIEHHQSSDDRASEDFLSNPQQQLAGGDLLAHEFSHSWNGKYRRPADLTTANFQIPMQTDLLWVYEGMNQYLGDVLTFRSGIRDRKLFPDYIASVYAAMDTEPGRLQDPLIDTAAAAPYLYLAKGDYSSLRRSSGDFYSEGELVWLDADTIIRETTSGHKSLDDFLHAYAGPPDSGPKVVTYTRADIENLLNSVSPYDWHGFFSRYVYNISEHPPADELERSGWKLVYNAEPNVFDDAGDSVGNQINLWYSLGLQLDEDGSIVDVRDGAPAWRAGLSPGMKVVAIDGQEFSADVLQTALKAAQHLSASLAVLVEHDKWYRTYQVDYHGGLRHPHLARIPARPDMLAKIAASKIVAPKLVDP